MKTITQVENIGATELLTEIERIVRNGPAISSSERLFSEIVPWLTKELTATALRGSTAFVDSLIASAELQPFFPYKDRPATVRFRTEDVLKLRAAGKKGRK